MKHNLFAVLFFMFSFLIGSSVNLSAQLAYEISDIYGIELYYSNGEDEFKLTKQQIRDLSSSGFDYEQYRHLNKLCRISSVAVFSGGVMMALGSYFGQRNNFDAAIPLILTGAACTITGLCMTRKIVIQTDSLVDNYNNSMTIGLASSGMGLLYSF